MTTNNYNLAPFLLKPILVPRVWGKTSLAPWYPEGTNTQPETKIGEVWLTGAENVIQGGDNDGRTLGDLSAQCTGTLDGVNGGGEFPLLVKFLFPDDKLSVQVHPDDDDARAAGLKRGKTECWYVLEAVPGATVSVGLADGVGVEELRAAAADGTMERLLKTVPVVPGDLIFVDAGTVHAIGAGVAILEVQQNSDTTYRLFDYGRDRELHLDQGLKVVKTKTGAGKIPAKDMSGTSRVGFSRLIESKYFVVDRFEVPPGYAFEMPMDGVGCVVAVKGKAAANQVRFNTGEAVVIPAGSVTMSSADGAIFLRCFEPMP